VVAYRPSALRVTIGPCLSSYANHMAGRLHKLIAWISPHEWLAIVLLGVPLAAWLIMVFPPILGSIVVIACLTSGVCAALAIGFLRERPFEDSGHLAVKLALLFLLVCCIYDLHVIDFGCIDPGGVWDWNRMKCRHE
jgi:hypothetical protein